MPYPYTLMPDGHTMEPEDVVKPPPKTQEDSTSTQPPKPDPATGPPAFDSGPSPYLTQEVTSYAQPPSTDEEAERRRQRTERARERFQNAKQSDSTAQSASAGAQAADTPPDIDEIKLRYATGAGGITIHPVDIEAQIAAQHNDLLDEALRICQYEGVPPILRNHPDIFLGLCEGYGMDEEKDAEARDFLSYWLFTESHYADDPLIAARKVALYAFGTDKAVESFKAYKAAVEAEYGVTFEHAENADEWNLANIVMAHAALEMAASVFGDRLRDISGIDIDDATAFRWIFGPLTINHSTEVRMEAHAEVFGPLIEVYWKRKEGDDRNYNLYPYVLLHELGHRLNTIAGFGEVWGALSINKHPDHPESRAGMGKSAQRPLHMVVGVSESHGMYGEADVDAKHVEMLQYGEQLDHNEVTADGILNWLVHQITRGKSGLAGTADGQNWLEFMNKHMDAWIMHAVTFGIMNSGRSIDLTEDERDAMPFPLPVGRGVLKWSSNARSGPATKYANVSGGSPLPEGHDVIVLGRNTKAEDSDYPEWVAVFYRGDVNWIYSDGVELPDGVSWKDLPELGNEHKLTYDLSIAAQADTSWFPMMVEAAYGR